MENNETLIYNNKDTANQITKISELLLQRREYLWKNTSKNTSNKDGAIKTKLDKLLGNPSQEPETNQLTYFFIDRWCGPFKNLKMKEDIRKFLVYDAPQPGLIRVKESIKSLQENLSFFTDSQTNNDKLDFSLILNSPLEKAILEAEVKRVAIDYKFTNLIKKRHPNFSIDQEATNEGLKINLSK
jgi:hypothetical protein